MVEKMFDITPLELEDERLIAYAAPAHVRCVLCMGVYTCVWRPIVNLSRD